MRLDWEITGEAKEVAYNKSGAAVFTFEIIEQAEKFISVYDKEIKKIMGVI